MTYLPHDLQILKKISEDKKEAYKSKRMCKSSNKWRYKE